MTYQRGDKALAEVVKNTYDDKLEIRYRVGDECIRNHEVLIIGARRNYTDTDNAYVILIDDPSLNSWQITDFYISRFSISKKYLGKKGWEVDEKFLRPIKTMRCKVCRGL